MAKCPKTKKDTKGQKRQKDKIRKYINLPKKVYFFTQYQRKSILFHLKKYIFWKVLETFGKFGKVEVYYITPDSILFGQD